MPKLAVVRVRGSVKTRADVLHTLRMLGLTRANHCVVVDGTPPYAGMLRKAKDYITWGEVGLEALKKLLRRWGRLAGGARLTDEYVKSHTPYASIDEFAEDVYACKANLSDLPGLKKVFRLHPPRRGYRAIKRPFKGRGDLGYRGRAIDALLERMT